MGIIFLMVCASASIALIFLICFIWSVKSDQFEDLETPAYRILMDDNDINEQNRKETQINE